MGVNVVWVLGFIVNVSTLNNTLPLSNPSCKSSNIIDANTEEDTSYANLPTFEEDGIK